jgi:hypothetical protein
MLLDLYNRGLKSGESKGKPMSQDSALAVTRMNSSPAVTDEKDFTTPSIRKSVSIIVILMNLFNKLAKD